MGSEHCFEKLHSGILNKINRPLLSYTKEQMSSKTQASGVSNSTFVGYPSDRKTSKTSSCQGCLFNLHHIQEKWRCQGNIRSQVAQQENKKEEIQNGDTLFHFGDCAERRLHVISPKPICTFQVFWAAANFWGSHTTMPIFSIVCFFLDSNLFPRYSPKSL